MEKQDVCNVYGLYYTEDGETVDQGTVEVVDVNDYYGWTRMKEKQIDIFSFNLKDRAI